MILVFVLGYAMIATEHSIKIDKAASALLTGGLCWTLLVFGRDSIPAILQGDEFIHSEILHHIGEIAEIVFFLIGAMIIVEIIDSYGGFEIVTNRIKTTNKTKLLWIICFITFFFSSLLDNLTTSIVMAALLRKLITDKKNLWFFGSMVILSANAGGAWSPIGDVTTIMLWVDGNVSAGNIVAKLFLPSLVCMVVPLIIASFMNKGDLVVPTKIQSNHEVTTTQKSLIFWVGVISLLGVPIYKNITHLPPFLGMLISLSIMWIMTELICKNSKPEFKEKFDAAAIIRKIDFPSILFFIGILLAVASLQTAGHLGELSKILEEQFGDIYIINMLIGLLSSVVDNVPLVAGTIGMYSLDVYPMDHMFWELLAYCAGTGGSCLIIGSAAGVAIMGIMKIDFMWYFKKITLLALLGYFAGIATFWLLF